MNIRVDDPVKLSTDGEAIASKAAEYSQEIKRIYEIIDALKRSWTGQSATRYTQSVESFREDFETFAQSIKEFGDLINAIGSDYQTLENNL